MGLFNNTSELQEAIRIMRDHIAKCDYREERNDALLDSIEKKVGEIEKKTQDAVEAAETIHQIRNVMRWVLLALATLIVEKIAESGISHIHVSF